MVFGIAAAVVAYAFVPIEVMMVVAAIFGVVTAITGIILMRHIREITQRNHSK